MIEREEGGSKGYRGAGYAKARKRALYLGQYRSSATGSPQGKVQLQIDHIIPYRIGGLTSHTNEQTNLRISDFSQNKYIDFAEGFQTDPPLRRMRSF